MHSNIYLMVLMGDSAHGISAHAKETPNQCAEMAKLFQDEIEKFVDAYLTIPSTERPDSVSHAAQWLVDKLNKTAASTEKYEVASTTMKAGTQYFRITYEQLCQVCKQKITDFKAAANTVTFDGVITYGTEYIEEMYNRRNGFYCITLETEDTGAYSVTMWTLTDWIIHLIQKYNSILAPTDELLFRIDGFIDYAIVDSK